MSDDPRLYDSGDIEGSVSESTPAVQYDGMTRSQASNLYISHLLSTWNIRTYEFAAILFTADAYPGTLMVISTRGIVRTLASICLLSSVGGWVDNAPDRLKTLVRTISINRIAVISATALWLFIVELGTDDVGVLPKSNISGLPAASVLKGTIFAFILVFEVLESLSAAANMLSMERDWVVTAASPDGKPYDLTHLNSAMRRIDLVCKLVAPILISIVISATNVKIGILVVGAMSIASWPIELWCARKVWARNPQLQVPKSVEGFVSGDTLPPQGHARRSFLSRASQGLRGYFEDLRKYFSSPSQIWIPSVCLATLHFSGLAYSTTFITYLLAVGFSLNLITLARAAGSIVEISSTIVTPFGVSYLGKANDHGRSRDGDRGSEESTTVLIEDLPEQVSKTEIGLERLGLWGISFQLINLVPVVFALWSLTPSTPKSLPFLMPQILNPNISRLTLTFILFFFLSVSRLGLWIYDLTTQQLTQTMAIPSQRSSFTGVEYSFISLFELSHNIMTIIFHKPEQFRWIAVVSLLAVAVSTTGYAYWVWNMRGHLIHFEKACKCVDLRRGFQRR